MKRRVLLEDYPPSDETVLLLWVLPLAIAVIAFVALRLILW